VAAIAVIAAATACGGGNSDEPRTEGPPRSFMMGISSLPRELNSEAYGEAFELADTSGELVLIQRAPPWTNFLPDGEISDETAATTAAEVEALKDNDLSLFFAIDPTDGATGRDRLVDLPAEVAAGNFGDPAVQSALLAYAEYVALNYKPDYLAFGVEMNLYFNKNENDVESFRALYLEAYDRIKQASPDTSVTVTMQYEDLQALLPTEDRHFPQWPLLQSFEESLDVVAISTYPSFAFPNTASIPENYYTQLRAYTDRPIVIAEMGYSSEAGVQGINSGTEEDQAEFVQRIAREAEEMSMPFIVWFAGWDPTYAKDSPYVAFQHIGLRRGDDTEKPAWALWSEHAARPYEAETQAGSTNVSE
jgi:hypothetical protein